MRPRFTPGMLTFLAICVGLLGLIGIFAGYMSSRSRDYQGRGITTQAAVVSLSQTRALIHGELADFNTVVVRYRDISAERQAQVMNVDTDLYETLHVGSAIQVVYLPGSDEDVMLPREIAVDLANERWLYVIGGALFAPAIGLFWAARRRARSGG